MAQRLAQSFLIPWKKCRNPSGTRVASPTGMQSTIVLRAALSACLMLGLAACSGTESDNHVSTGGNSNAGASSVGGSTSAGGNSATGGSTVSNGGGGPIACGSTTCSADQYCVIPCCGGAAPACFSVGDAGTCPSGSHSGCNMPATTGCAVGTTCCQYNPCVPPPPYCTTTKPTGCTIMTDRTCRILCA